MSEIDIVSDLKPFIGQHEFIPSSILGDLLYITNFFKYFKDHTLIYDFQMEELYVQLVHDGPNQLKLVYLIKLAFIKMIIEEYRYGDSQNILLINVIKHYYQYCKIYQRKRIDEISTRFNRELMFLWSQLFHDFLSQDTIMIENKAATLDILQNEFKGMGLLNQDYKSVKVDKKVQILKSMVQAVIQLEVVKNWAKPIISKKDKDGNVHSKGYKDMMNKSQKIQVLKQKSQSLQMELQDSRIKKNKQTNITKKIEMVDQQINGLSNEVEQLQIQQDDNQKSRNVVSCNYIGSLQDDINLYYFQFKTDTVYVQHVHPNGEDWYIVDQQQKIDGLIKQLQKYQAHHELAKDIQKLIDTRVLIMKSDVSNLTMEQYSEKVDGIECKEDYSVKQNIYEQIASRIMQIESEYSEYLAYKCCRWESPQKKAIVIEKLKQLDQMDIHEQSQLILQILNSFLSVQYMYIFDPQIDYEGHKNIFKERYDEKYVNELERFQKMDSDEVQVYRMQVGVLGSYRVMHNYRGQIKEFLVAGQPIQYLNVLVFYMHISIISYVKYYVDINIKRTQVDLEQYQYKKRFQKCQMCKTSKKAEIVECSVCKKTYHSICMTFESDKSCQLCNQTIMRTRTRRLQLDDDE